LTSPVSVDLKLKKNNRTNIKSFTISIKKPKTIIIVNKNETLNNETTNNQPIIIENFEEILYIDYKPSKGEDIVFTLMSLDESINFSSISILWIVRHFKDKNQYLNGQNELLLRINLSDLLIGINEIKCLITINSTKKMFEKTYFYNVDRNPFGGNCLVSPDSGFSMLTNLTIIQDG